MKDTEGFSLVFAFVIVGLVGIAAFSAWLTVGRDTFNNIETQPEGKVSTTSEMSQEKIGTNASETKSEPKEKSTPDMASNQEEKTDTPPTLPPKSQNEADTSKSEPVPTPPDPTPPPVSTSTIPTQGSSQTIWNFDVTVWKPNSTPPVCPDPFVLTTPVDMSLVTAALWPGQTRGTDYKAHGGFRFDGAHADDIMVRVPIDSHLIQAGRYLESGDIQYLLFFSVSCGYVYRFDHVRELSPKLSEALMFLPEPTEGDSRTQYLNPPVYVEGGEVIGTSVGVLPDNIFVDFGLYDVREPNGITPNPEWADEYATDVEFGRYGVCFFDYLPALDGEKMRSLPTGKEGKTSDYCN